MSFLKKIRNRINKSSKSNGFNLKKYANKKVAYLEEEELGAGLTSLEQFKTPGAKPEAGVDPQTSIAMQRYIDQNANAPQPAPMPAEWLNNIDLNLHFQQLAQQSMGNMSEAFVSRALGATEVSQEAPPSTEGDWQSAMGDFDVDLVESFFSSPNVQRTIQSIAQSIKKSGYRAGIDDDTANEVAQESVMIALGKPGEKQRGGTRRDQRFNYFLANPDKMPPEVAQALRANPSSSVDDTIAYLKDNFGEVLIQSLLQLIMTEDPSIKRWVLKNAGNVGGVIEESLGTSLTGGDERGSNLGDTDIASKHLNRIEQREVDKNEINDQTDALTKASMAFAKLYVQDVVRDMSEVLDKATENSYNRYPQKADKIERMQMFNKRVLDQYLSVFDQPSYLDKNGNITFKNKDGQISIPYDVLVGIFGGNMDKDAEALSTDILNQRRNKESEFDLMKWFSAAMAEEQKKGASSSLLSHSALQDSYKDAYMVKTIISNAIKSTPPATIASAPHTVFTDTKDATAEQMLSAFDNLSNANGNIPEQEKVRRRLRYIDRTAGDMEVAKAGQGKSSYEKYKRFATMGPTDSINSMRPNAQYDARYFMEGLDDVHRDPSNEYMGDIYQAFIGSLNPHRKVKDDYFPDIYKKLTGLTGGEEVQEDTSMLTEPERQQFVKLEKAKDTFARHLQTKQNVIQSEMSKAETKASSYHKKINSAYEKHLEMLKKQGFPPISLGDFVGVPHWDGDSILEKDDYVRMVTDRGLKIGKAIDVLWGQDDKQYNYKTMPPLRKVELLKNAPIQYTATTGGQKIPANIRQQSEAYTQEKLNEIEAQIEEFKNSHNMTQSQYNIASALCRGYFKKLANIERLSNSYNGLKMAEVAVDLDMMIVQIEERFKADFDSILGM